jgi:hypothetical protein
MPINTNDQFIASRKPRRRISKVGSGALVIGRLHSTWLFGGFPVQGTLIGANTAQQYNRATTGSAGPEVAAAGGNTFFLGSARLRLQSTSNTIGGDIDIYDRLVLQAVPNVTLTTAQTMPAQALPARAGAGVDVEAFLEVQAATGGTAATATISYTNSAGVTGRTGTASITASAPVGAVFPFVLQAGDLGVQTIQTLTLSASIVSGNVATVLGRFLGTCPSIQTNVSEVQDYVELGLPDVGAEVCTWLLIVPTTTTSLAIQGAISYHETTP